MQKSHTFNHLTKCACSTFTNIGGGEGRLNAHGYYIPPLFEILLGLKRRKKRNKMILLSMQMSLNATCKGCLLPYEYNFLAALLDTRSTSLAFNSSHRLRFMTLQLAPESIIMGTGRPPIWTEILQLLKNLGHLRCQMHIHNHHHHHPCLSSCLTCLAL